MVTKEQVAKAFTTLEQYGKENPGYRETLKNHFLHNINSMLEGEQTVEELALHFTSTICG